MNFLKYLTAILLWLACTGLGNISGFCASPEISEGNGLIFHWSGDLPLESISKLPERQPTNSLGCIGDECTFAMARQDFKPVMDTMVPRHPSAKSPDQACYLIEKQEVCLVNGRIEVAAAPERFMMLRPR